MLGAKPPMPQTLTKINFRELRFLLPSRSMKTFRFLTFILLCASLPLHAGSGSSPSRFKAIPERMLPFVEEGTISGAVTLVAHKGEVVSLEAVGLADIANKKPMKPDTLFWI